MSWNGEREPGELCSSRRWKQRQKRRANEEVLAVRLGFGLLVGAGDTSAGSGLISSVSAGRMKQSRFRGMASSFECSSYPQTQNLAVGNGKHDGDCYLC